MSEFVWGIKPAWRHTPFWRANADNARARRRWRRRNLANPQRRLVTGGLLRWRTYVSHGGDRATVRRVEHGRVDFSYVGPPGVWGRYPADTSGRSSLPLSEFLGAFPVLAEEN